jgi:uncharacterized protein YgiM (DUF1202 family)
MKNGLYGLIILILTLIASNALATADGPDYWQVRGVANDDVLNIRSEPDSQSRKLGEIPPDGKCIKNLRCRGGLTLHEFTTLSEEEKKKITIARPRWCYIEYKGIKGWVAGRYLSEGACGTGNK